ncbi:MAG: hypothetical protein LUF04_15065 [Bacteroides sp.]|nr:hypothetical protein [Bacteroides sp.]
MEKYEDDYLGPYLAHRQTYGEDIHTGVHKKVEEWLFYIHELRDKSIPEGLRVIQEDESLVSDEPLEIESYQEEDGTWVVLARKRSGENFSKTILLENEQTQVEIEITYKWIGETETWKELSKLEKTYVAHQNPILIIGYVWDKQTHAWLLEAKAIMDYTYDEGSDLLSTTRTTYEWKEDTWCEDYREEVDFESGEPVSIKVYEQGLLVFSEELKK